MAPPFSFSCADLLIILVLIVVLLDGASLKEIKSRSLRDLWEEDFPDDPDDDKDNRFWEIRRTLRQNGLIPLADNSTTNVSTTLPPFSDSTTPEFTSSSDLPPYSTSMSPPPPPSPTPDPSDKCGTFLTSPRFLNEPSPCFFNSTCSNPLCMQDFSLDILYSCLWSVPVNRLNKNPANSTPPLIVEVPGNCQRNNTPPAFANLSSTSTPKPTCFFHPVAHTLTANATKCVCTKWDGSCPEEELKTCETDQLLAIANEMIRSIMQISESVQPGCHCDYELEQKLPVAIQAVKQKRNLYRANMLLFQAKERHICNRRRLMTCQPDGTCGCAPGAARREYRGDGFKILSYYCYAIRGHCDEDPANVMEQFEPAVRMVRRHYGDINEPSHKESVSGCFFNFCKNAEHPQQFSKTCLNF